MTVDANHTHPQQLHIVCHTFEVTGAPPVDSSGRVPCRAATLHQGRPLALLGSAPCHEIAPHLVRMAFLHLVIFDRRAGRPPIRERTSSSELPSPQGRRITVVQA